MKNRVEAYLAPAIGIVGFLLVWHALVVWTGTRILPGPLEVRRGIAELVRKGLLAAYIRDSLLRVTAGYSLAIGCGIPLGAALGWYRTAADWADGIIQIMR